MLWVFFGNGDGLLTFSRGKKQLGLRLLRTDSGHYLLPSELKTSKSSSDGWSDEIELAVNKATSHLVYHACQQWNDVSGHFLPLVYGLQEANQLQVQVPDCLKDTGVDRKRIEIENVKHAVPVEPIEMVKNYALGKGLDSCVDCPNCKNSAIDENYDENCKQYAV